MMDKLELIQYIGNEICEGCGPYSDCGIDPDPKSCSRILNAMNAFDKFIELNTEE